MRGVTILTRFAADRVAKRLRRYIAPLMSDAALDESRFDALLMGNGSGNLDRFVKRKSGSPRIISNIELPTLCETFPAAQGRTFSWLKERTAHCLAGRFCELGSGYIDLSDSTGGIRWLEDFKSGVTWPLTHYLRTEIVKGDSVSDIKTIWELSRFQIGPNLAQMELLTGDDIYRKRFIELVDDWQRKNPYPLGPNWNCSMEVALRAMNLLLALELFERRSPLPEPFLKAVYVALFQHGRHIRANPENTARGLNTNHYLANLIGLLTLGSFFEELPECAEWRDFAVEELAVEIDLQTTEDGFCYESSSAYHLLVLEFYLYALMFCRNNGIILPISYIKRLSLALKVTRTLKTPAGHLLNLGDNDSGRLFKLAPRADHDPNWLLAWGNMEGVARDASRGAPLAEPETVWLYGHRVCPGGNTGHGLSGADPTPVWKANGDGPAQRSRYLRHSGLVTLRREDLLMSVNVADIGVNGFGGHKHNDQLALTLCWGDEEFLIDPGTLCYTKDEPERNRLRSSAAHSTVTLSGREANRFIPGYMFALKRDGSPRVTAWLSTEELDLLRAEHDCYGRLKGAPAVARTVYFDKRLCFWLIRDQVIPAGGPAPDSPGWLSSLITGERAVEISDSGAVLRGAKSEERHIKLTVFTQSVEVFGEKFISAPSYGVESVGTRIMFCPRQGQTDLIWGIFPYPVAGKREITGDLLREKLRLLEWPDDNCAFPPGQLNADLQLQSESRGRT